MNLKEFIILLHQIILNLLRGIANYSNSNKKNTLMKLKNLPKDLINSIKPVLTPIDLNNNYNLTLIHF